ncbi:unnamed protein product [Chondrus crispus]|uniref:Uncharacterized protein n=1 Tax=Chondrus crispus TaxID=2769 RepID=R7QKZ3_CHOCR|nr:unnamed protein product [Chondrus crispus]CDF38151.1 unnamed protein product [Chondrus crispus]|eukprot:XP_005718020.1 unnamed protein product [Chondrus crispus]
MPPSCYRNSQLTCTCINRALITEPPDEQPAHSSITHPHRSRQDFLPVHPERACTSTSSGFRTPLASQCRPIKPCHNLRITEQPSI